ncbi:MAG: rhodanese-like domain-containing protein [Chloroflexota bacterium]
MLDSPTGPLSAPTEAEVAAIRRVSAREAAILVESGSATLVDVRYRGSYEGCHIEGAVSLSLEAIEAAPSLEGLEHVPARHLLVLYCT